MKKVISAGFCLCLAAGSVSGQTTGARRPPVKSAPKKAVQPITVTAAAAAAPTNEVSEAEWQTMSGALREEKWEAAATIAARRLAEIKTDNAKKQLAQLRYVYLYALAAKAAEGNISHAELERAANSFVGQEFVAVGRQLLADCRTKVNYICAAKDGGGRILRVTATNRAGTAIHSFEYVVLNEKFDVRAHSEKVAFVGGTLKKVEISPLKTGTKVIRLIFEKGFVKLATD